MPFKIDQHERFGEGINRTMATNNPEYPRGACWDLLNMVYDRTSEDPEKMGGYTRLGSTDVGGAVSGLFDYDEGTRLISTDIGGKIYEYAGSDWAQSTNGTGFNTANTTRWSGTMFYGATTSANLLLLCNGIDAPQKYTSGAGVSALGGSPPSTGQFPVSFAGRLWMAAGSTLFYSAADNCEDWATLGGSFQIDRGTGDITGLYNFMGNLLIFKKRKILRLLPGTSLASTSVRDVVSRIGSPSHWSVQESGEKNGSALYFMSNTGIQSLTATAATGGFIVKNTADGIKRILDSRLKTSLRTSWATFNEDRGEYWLQYPITDQDADAGVIGNTARRGTTPRWTRHDLRGKTAGSLFLSSNEEIQVIGDDGGRIYQMHSGDSRGVTGAAGFQGKVETAAYTQGDRGRMKRYGRIFVDLSTAGDYEVIVRQVLGRAELPNKAGNTLTPSGFGSLDGWGTGKWGEAVWGGSTVAGRWVRPTKVHRGSYSRLIVETTGPNEWFKMNGLALEYAMRRRILAA